MARAKDKKNHVGTYVTLPIHSFDEIAQKVIKEQKHQIDGMSEKLKVRSYEDRMKFENLENENKRLKTELTKFQNTESIVNLDAKMIYQFSITHFNKIFHGIFHPKEKEMLVLYYIDENGKGHVIDDEKKINAITEVIIENVKKL